MNRRSKNILIRVEEWKEERIENSTCYNVVIICYYIVIMQVVTMV